MQTCINRPGRIGPRNGVWIAALLLAGVSVGGAVGQYCRVAANARPVTVGYVHPSAPADLDGDGLLDAILTQS